ncbi:MAG: hypothetical protein ACN6OP_13660, partial [Pseudomonadales bacterium]
IEITWQVRPFSEADKRDAALTIDSAIELERARDGGAAFASIDPVWQRKAERVAQTVDYGETASVYVLDLPEFAPLIDVARKTDGYQTTELGNGYVRIDGNPTLQFRRKELGFKPAVWYGALTGALAGQIRQFDMDALMIVPRSVRRRQPWPN